MLSASFIISSVNSAKSINLIWQCFNQCWRISCYLEGTSGTSNMWKVKWFIPQINCNFLCILFKTELKESAVFVLVLLLLKELASDQPWTACCFPCRGFLECLINPLQEQMEEWKRGVNTLDKDHAKGTTNNLKSEKEELFSNTMHWNFS